MAMEDEFVLADFFTHQYRISGKVGTKGQRLTDVLDDELSSTLELRDVEVTRIITPEEVVTSHVSALLEKERIVFVVERMAGTDMTERRFYRHVDTTEWDVFLTVPSFELSGRMHVRGTGDLRTMLLTWTRRFIPLTRATAVFTLFPEISFAGDVIIVNKSFVEVVCTDAKFAL